MKLEEEWLNRETLCRWARSEGLGGQTGLYLLSCATPRPEGEDI